MASIVSSTAKPRGALDSKKSSEESENALAKICVYYDGACPSCIKDSDHYQRLAGKQGEHVSWFDITHKEDELVAIGIDPKKAIKELHISIQGATEKPVVLSELDAYIVLMNRVLLLRPFAWFLSLSLVKPFMSKLYHKMVAHRLSRSGRL